VMISGWGLDRTGKKMSKRAGNFVDPAEIIAKYSADSLRYWAAGATLGHDLRFLEDDVKGGKRLLTKLWNSTRFTLQNIGLQHGQAVPETPTPADRWIRSLLIEVVQQATAALELYEYSKAVRAVETFFWKDWCDHYLEIVKDRFRAGSAGSAVARFTPGQVEAARRTLQDGTYALLRLFAPFLPFLTEELYHQAIKPRLGGTAPDSIHLAPWPEDEATRQIDLWSGQRDAAAEQQGALLVSLVGAIRQGKTAAKLGAGRPLQAIYVVGEPEKLAQIKDLEADWLAAARAETVHYRAPDDAGVAMVELVSSGLAIGIVAAPADNVA